MICLACGNECPAEFRFCGHCGAALPESGPGGVPRGEVEAERRLLTVLFSDLVESTRLAERLDPEELRAVVRRYQESCGAVIARFGGYIAQYLGDGLLVYFGYPRAHEDDARRAVLSGLGITAAMADLEAELAERFGVRLAVRVGIHTGEVVAGLMGAGDRHERLALGQTPNLAARLQGLAEPDTVVISAATYTMVRDHFAVEALGPQQLRGASEPLTVYRVVRPRESRRRPDGSDLHGRQEELDQLRARFAEVGETTGQGVLLTGDAGIGKSRLVRAFVDRVSGAGAAPRLLACSPYAQNSALQPLLELLQDLSGFARDDTREAQMGKLRQLVSRERLGGEESVALLAQLLFLPVPEGALDPRFSPQRRKELTTELLLKLLLGPPPAGTVTLLVVEDLHWVDPSTLEVLGSAVLRAASLPVFLLLTARPGFEAPWPALPHLSTLALGRLSDPVAERMVTALAGGKPLPQPLLRQLIERTDGVPLFIEELTRAVLESPQLTALEDRYELAGRLQDLPIPTTLQGSLAARLDRLAAVRPVAQLGAVLGREFGFEMLQAVSAAESGTLVHHLHQLVEAGLLVEQGEPPRSTYLFRHALIQEAAYSSLLKSRRAEVHRRIARLLAERLGDGSVRPEEVARHYTEAGEVGLAVEHWLAAGRAAMSGLANLEAIEHLRRGLELLPQLGEPAGWAGTELALQSALGQALSTTRGYPAGEVEQALARAWQLARELGVPGDHLGVLWGLAAFHQARGEIRRSLDLVFEALASAAVAGPQQAEAHLLLAGNRWFLGDLARSWEHLEEAGRLLEERGDTGSSLPTGQDTEATGSFYAALVLWLSGDLTGSAAMYHRGLARARRLSQPFTEAGASIFGSWLFQLRREPVVAAEHARAAIATADEFGFDLWRAWAELTEGWAEAVQGNPAGLEGLERGLAGIRGTGMRLFAPYFLSQRAEAERHLGHRSAATASVAEARRLAAATDERFWEAELLRLEGELHGELGGPPEEVEELLWAACERAREQGAASLELRGALALARRWRERGEAGRARQLLREAREKIRGGEDTPDVREADGLLAELG
jgi:class 3 adenylate cyclase